MKRSPVAPSLKQEQVDASKLQEGGVLNNLELRLGISSDNGLGGGGGGDASPWLGVGVHPWSLPAREEKAAVEQAQHRPNECLVPREDRPQLVGWPPLRTFRKNLCTPKPAYVDDLSKVKPISEEEEDHHGAGASGHERSTMFVKVNLEGYAPPLHCTARQQAIPTAAGLAALDRTGLLRANGERVACSCSWCWYGRSEAYFGEDRATEERAACPLHQ